jgi:ribosomal-protein-alanine N-acetyltransferase
MTFFSKRLTYEKFTADDKLDYKRWYMNDEVMKYITGRGLNEQETETRFQKTLLINNTDPMLGFFAARDIGSRAFIGVMKMVWYGEGRVEVGYGMLPEFWNKGYASEMMVAMIDYIRKLDAKMLVAIVHERHAASKHVLSKFDFRFDKFSDEENMRLEHYVRPL